LRDGTLVALPENGRLSTLDLKDAFTRDNRVTVFLGVPQLRPGSANVTDLTEGGAAAGGEGTRFLAENLDLDDENSPEGPQPVGIRLLNVKLLHSAQDLTGYDVIPLARMEKVGQAEALPRLDITYIPPVVACEAWKPLKANILQAIYNYLGNKIETLSTQVVSRGINFGTHNADDALLLGQLHLLNGAYALLNILAFADGIHPLLAYMELCRLVGQLAIFGETKRPPDLPKYDHDDLGGCFYRVKQYIENIKISEPNYEERPFIGEGLRIQVKLEPKWLESIWEMFVGVESSLKQEEVIRLLTRQGLLDMKIGSSIKVDEIFDRGSAGLEFTPHARPPRALPATAGLVYFQINRDSQKEEWDNVRRSLTLAIRLNQSRIVGNIQGQRSLQIQNAGQTTTFQFTLYLVPRGG
jgi:type VI secretion system protein ImpJ